jgi:glutaredoxin
MYKKTIIIIVLILAGFFYWVLTNLFFISKDNYDNSTNYDYFAKCLTEKDVVMYSAGACPYCKIQKKIFRDSFKYLSVIDCSHNLDLCIEKGIEYLPSWSIDNIVYPGEKTIEDLKNMTGCKIENISS